MFNKSQTDYLICIFYWTLHWLSFTFQLLITSFVSFIGHDIGRSSNSSFWLPHLYLLLDISEAGIWRTANVLSNKRYKWGNQKLQFGGRPMSCPIKDTNEVRASLKLLLLITSFESFIGHDIGRPPNCSFWLPHLYLLLDITMAVHEVIRSYNLEDGQCHVQ
jgi:hypothetical protein